MNTFYIVRHGETENNRAQRFSGWIDTPLTDEGVQNALSSASKLRSVQIDIIISSDMGRAFATAYIVSRTIGYTAEIIRDSKLREVNYGDFANKPYDTYPELSPEENAQFVAPNGESLEQMQQRVLERLRAIDGENQNKTILIVAHDGTINAIRAAFKHESVGIADLTRNPHDYVGVFTLADGAVVSFEELK